MKILCRLVFFSFIFISLSCEQGGGDSKSDLGDLSVTKPGAPKVVLQGSGGNPSVKSSVSYEITNLPFWGGYIYLFSNSTCSEVSLRDDINGSFTDLGNRVRLDLNFEGLGEYNLSLMSVSTKGEESPCVKFDYTVLPVPIPNPTSILTANPSINSEITIAMAIPDYLSINAYSDASCSTLVGSEDFFFNNDNFDLGGFAVGTTDLYFEFENNTGLKSDCSATPLSYTRQPLLAPTSITINESSPGTSDRVTVNVSGGHVQADVKVVLYSDATCNSLNKITERTVYSGTDVDISVYSIAPSSTNNFYATVQLSDGQESTCSPATASYVRSAFSTPSSVALAPGFTSSMNKTSVDFVVSGVKSGERVYLYQTNDCSGSSVGSATASSTSATITMSSHYIKQVNTPYTVYARVEDSYYDGVCSSSSATYTFIDSFTSRFTTAGYYPEYIDDGDFNNDGVTDFAFTTGSKVETYTGNGDGTFSLMSVFNDEDSISSAAELSIADFNNDNFDDIVIVNYKTVNVFLNNQSGSFSSAYKHAANYSTAWAEHVITADFDGDGNMDITFQQGYSLYTKFGNGDGTFQSDAQFSLTTGTADIKAVDFNGDGYTDIAYTQSGSINIALNNGSGVFTATQVLALTNIPSVYTFADFTGDGSLDLVFYESNSLKLYNNDGSGSLSLDQTISLNSKFANAFDIAVLDYNNDGTIDFIVPHKHSNDLSILTRKNDGSYNLPILQNQIGGADGILVGDYNQDGKDDFLQTNSIGNAYGEILIYIQ